MTVRGDLAPTARLRWVEEKPLAIPFESGCAYVPQRRLQQWWAEAVPTYMRNSAAGEWRDVPVGVEAP